MDTRSQPAYFSKPVTFPSVRPLHDLNLSHREPKSRPPVRSRCRSPRERRKKKKTLLEAERRSQVLDPLEDTHVQRFVQWERPKPQMRGKTETRVSRDSRRSATEPARANDRRTSHSKRAGLSHLIWNSSGPETARCRNYFLHAGHM